MSRDILSIVLPRLVATVMSLGLAIWALNGFMAHTASATVRMLAKAIEDGGQPKLDVLDQLHENDTSDRILARCDSTDLRALAAVRLREIDLAYVTADPARADRAGAAAEGAIRKALSCGPLDGNLWLRLASLQTARFGPSPEALEFLRLSHWIAPSEGWILRARVDFASRLLGAGLKSTESELRSDIRTLVSFDSNSNIADMFMTAPEAARAIYREWIQLLPEERKRSLARALERRGVDLTAP